MDVLAWPSAGAPPKVPEPPLPNDAADFARWQYTRRSRRMLYGLWDEDLRQYVELAVGPKRTNAWKLIDLSANVYKSSMTQLAVCHRKPGKLTNAGSSTSADAMTKALRKGGFWSLMRRFERDTLGLREMLLRLDVVDGRPLVRPAFPDYVLASASAEEPDRPVVIKEAILRDDGGRSIWTWDCWSIADPANPRMQVLDERGNDASPKFLRRADGSPAPEGGLVGRDYTWRWRDGRPFLPYVCYHGATTGQLWDWAEGRELVEGTFIVAILWTFFGHCVRTASWPQRWGMNVTAATDVAGGDERTRRDRVETDPATVALFLQDPDANGPPQLGQWIAGADPSTLADAIALYERRLAAFANINPANVQRVAGDPRSGFALAITREGQREAQDAHEPQMIDGDLEAITKLAAMMNRATRDELAEDDYGLRFEALPLSAEERAGILEEFKAGLIGKVEAHRRLHPGMTEEEAEAAVEAIERQGKPAAAKPPPGNAPDDTDTDPAEDEEIPA